MIVCHCKALSDRVIRQAVRDGARTHREVALACGAGRSCGGCRPAVLGVIDDEAGGEPCAAPARIAATG